MPHEYNGIWNWKFPGRDYKQADKQKYEDPDGPPSMLDTDKSSVSPSASPVSG
ncbi:MAG: hypothetical protein ABIO83_09975 [Ilumatobacteraceae bacterium]